MTAHVPGQMALPELADALGFESAALPPKQERFCWEYILKDGRQTDAYQTAFPGVSRKSATVNSSRLLRDEKIKNRIEQIKAELQRRYVVSADKVVFYLSQALNTDRAEFIDDNGNVRPVSEISSEAKRILDLDFTIDRYGNQKAVYRLPKRIDAAAELARILGLVKNPVTPVDNEKTTTGILVEFVQPDSGKTTQGIHNLSDEELARIAGEGRVNFYIPANGRDTGT